MLPLPRVLVLSCGALLICCKSGTDGERAPLDGGPVVSASGAVSASSVASPPLPAWATALSGKTFTFASRLIEGTLTFGNAPALWSKDRTFVWFDAVDEGRRGDGTNWIEVKAVADGFDTKCLISSEAQPGIIAPSNPAAGHRIKIKLGCPAGNVTELDFVNGLPLVLKWDPASAAWTASAPATR
ncbi:MAG: hypothetical protein ACLQVI_33555 [Polyangiaceae bacterium]